MGDTHQPDHQNQKQDETSNGATMLSKGLLNLYVPHLKQAQSSLKELTDKQSGVLADIEVQTRNFSEHTLKPTAELMNTVSAYKSKLITIKKRMLSIHQRTQALKKRAIFIKDFKTKESEEKLRKRRQEEALIAGSNSSNSAASSSKNESFSLYSIYRR